jgi:Holliday junction resolvase-like predicted endonuclease
VINRRAKGYRHEKKTVEWFRSMGYEACRCRARSGFDEDLWGADVIARNKDRVVFMQVKANKGHMAKGVKQLTVDENWPDAVDRLVVHWPPRARAPIFRDVSGDKR